MDLALYARVLWRFRVMIVAAAGLAIVLAFLAVARVSFVGGSLDISYRQAETWRSDTTMFVTQPGFPWGRTVSEFLPGNQQTGRPSVPVADPQRLSSLTALYAQLATSDSVKSLMTATERTEGAVSVRAIPAPPYSTPAILPLLGLRAQAPSPARAQALADRATAAFSQWLGQRQDHADIPAEQRVVVQVVRHASAPQLAAGRSKTAAGIVFLTVIAAALALAFVLENLRPAIRRARPADVLEEPADVAAPARLAA